MQSQNEADKSKAITQDGKTIIGRWHPDPEVNQKIDQDVERINSQLLEFKKAFDNKSQVQFYAGNFVKAVEDLLENVQTNPTYKPSGKIDNESVKKITNYFKSEIYFCYKCQINKKAIVSSLPKVIQIWEKANALVDNVKVMPDEMMLNFVKILRICSQAESDKERLEKILKECLEEKQILCSPAEPGSNKEWIEEKRLSQIEHIRKSSCPYPYGQALAELEYFIYLMEKEKYAAAKDSLSKLDELWTQASRKMIQAQINVDYKLGWITTIVADDYRKKLLNSHATHKLFDVKKSTAESDKKDIEDAKPPQDLEGLVNVVQDLILLIKKSSGMETSYYAYVEHLARIEMARGNFIHATKICTEMLEAINGDLGKFAFGRQVLLERLKNMADQITELSRKMGRLKNKPVTSVLESEEHYEDKCKAQKAELYAQVSELKTKAAKLKSQKDDCQAREAQLNTFKERIEKLKADAGSSKNLAEITRKEKQEKIKLKETALQQELKKIATEIEKNPTVHLIKEALPKLNFNDILDAKTYQEKAYVLQYAVKFVDIFHGLILKEKQEKLEEEKADDEKEATAKGNDFATLMTIQETLESIHLKIITIGEKEIDPKIVSMAAEQKNTNLALIYKQIELFTDKLDTIQEFLAKIQDTPSEEHLLELKRFKAELKHIKTLKEGVGELTKNNKSLHQAIDKLNEKILHAQTMLESINNKIKTQIKSKKKKNKKTITANPDEACESKVNAFIQAIEARVSGGITAIESQPQSTLKDKLNELITFKNNISNSITEEKDRIDKAKVTLSAKGKFIDKIDVCSEKNIQLIDKAIHKVNKGIEAEEKKKEMEQSKAKIAEKEEKLARKFTNFYFKDTNGNIEHLQFILEIFKNLQKNISNSDMYIVGGAVLRLYLMCMYLQSLPGKRSKKGKRGKDKFDQEHALAQLDDKKTEEYFWLGARLKDYDINFASSDYKEVQIIYQYCAAKFTSKAVNNSRFAGDISYEKSFRFAGFSYEYQGMNFDESLIYSANFQPTPHQYLSSGMMRIWQGVKVPQDIDPATVFLFAPNFYVGVISNPVFKEACHYLVKSQCMLIRPPVSQAPNYIDYSRKIIEKARCIVGFFKEAKNDLTFKWVEEDLVLKCKKDKIIPLDAKGLEDDFYKYCLQGLQDTSPEKLRDKLFMWMAKVIMRNSSLLVKDIKPFALGFFKAWIKTDYPDAPVELAEKIINELQSNFNKYASHTWTQDEVISCYNKMMAKHCKNTKVKASIKLSA